MSDGITAISFDPATADPSRAGTGVPGTQPSAGIQEAQARKARGAGGSTGGAKQAKAATGDTLTLSAEAKAEVASLQARDAEVKAHEMAHMAAGAGIVTSGASYTYEKGPDGRMYAVGGEVGIDTSPVKDNPKATLAKALHIQAAAMAPAEPSGQDRAVAAQAASMASQAAADAAKPKATEGGQAAKGDTAGAKASTGTSGDGKASLAPGSLLDLQA